MTKRLLSALLACLFVAGSAVYFPVAATDPAADYPELLITEIGVDQQSDPNDPANLNNTYKNTEARRSTDPFEFLEIYNNAAQTVNVFDYMLGYQGAASTNAEWFEHSVQCYTPFHPGADWWDGAFSENDSYWKNTKDAKPVNPSYDDGKVAPGEVFVAWVYNTAAHTIHATVEQFRAYWKIPANVKVFLLDGNDVDCKMNFSLKNGTTGTYLIMKQSDRFPARRSADSTFYVEMDNKHHPYAGTHYADLDEVISWAVVDFRTEPLKSYAAANGGQTATTNYTVSFLPYTDGTAAANGYDPSLKRTLRRAVIERINERAEATVGSLSAAQKSALAVTKTEIVRTSPIRRPALTASKTRPALLITEMCADTKADSSFSNKKIAAAPGTDYFEFLECYNNTDGELNIFDYMLGYQGGAATGVSTYFERSVQEYTPILPGSDWADAPYTAYDSFWTGSTVARPANPSYEEGVLKAGEVAVIWFYTGDDHKVNATVAEFRQFWNIPSNVKVFLFDANSNRDRNFNVKNSDTGTYYFMQESDRFPARRSDDESFYVEADRTDCRYYEDDNFDTMPEIISWAVIDFGCYDPLYSMLAAGSLPNYTYHYVPFTGEKKFVNGFLTVSFDSQKRMHLDSWSKSVADANVGTLTDAQKAAIQKARTAG